MKRFLLLLTAAVLLASCARGGLGPGLYRVQAGEEEGFLRIGTDSLGAPLTVLYRMGANLVADTAHVTLQAQRREYQLSFPDGRVLPAAVTPYSPPEFQLFTPDGLYREPRFKVAENKDVIFGRIIRNLQEEGEEANLVMDIFYPADDRTGARPLLLTLHEGAFREGDKRDTLLVEWNRYFASLGYVVSSVNYRVGYSRRNIEETDEAMYRALKDANAAVRFLLRRDSLRIHSDRIFAAGADAGAITALNLAFYQDETMADLLSGAPEDTVHQARTPMPRGFEIRAAANLWGAIPDTTYLYTTRVPVISFQAREDPVVPFGEGHPYEEPEEEDVGMFRTALRELLTIFFPETHLFRTMYGAGVIHRIQRSCGVASELHDYEGQRHNLFYQEDGTVDYPVYDEIKEQTAAFFASRMETSPVSLRQDSEDPQVFYIDLSEVETCFWRVDGGAVLGKSEDTIRVLFFPDTPKHTVTVSGRYTSGLTFCETLSL